MPEEEFPEPYYRTLLIGIALNLTLVNGFSGQRTLLIGITPSYDLPDGI